MAKIDLKSIIYNAINYEIYNGTPVNCNDSVSIDDYLSNTGTSNIIKRVYPTVYAMIKGGNFHNNISSTGKTFSTDLLLREFYDQSDYGAFAKRRIYTNQQDYEYQYDNGKYCLRPYIYLDKDKLKKAMKDYPDLIKMYESQLKDGTKYKVIEFGEYPQSVPTSVEIQGIGNAKKTGKVYYYPSKNGIVADEEYIFKGQKYVLAKYEGNIFDFLQVAQNAKPGYVWIKVKPIKWVVKEENTTTYNLSTEDAILGGIPYNLDNSKKYSCLYQNSTIRGFLNGINTNNITSNGEPKFASDCGGDFTDKGFLQSAFEIEDQNITTISPQIKSAKPTAIARPASNKVNLASFIVPTILRNTDELRHKGDPSFATNDYVFLESKEELENTTTDNERIVYPSDYAVMNNAIVSDKRRGHNNRPTTYYYLRTAEDDTNNITIAFKGDINSDSRRYQWISICPTINLDADAIIKARQNSTQFKIEPVKDTKGKTLYHTIEFGSYPQDKAENSDELEKLYNAGTLTATGKVYTGMFDSKNNDFKQNVEYLYKGKKYVRVLVKRYDEDFEFKDGTMLPPLDNTPLWAEVQPIKWKIKNYDELPKELNPDGKGTAKVISVRTEEAIISGLPFSNADASPESTMWQNSIPRAFLNGYDNYSEIDNGNGNAKFKAEENYNFQGKGFISEAFDSTLTMQASANKNNKYINEENEQVSEEIEVIKTTPQPVKRSRLERLNPDRTPSDERRLMTDTEIIKSWIDAGQSVLLRGPSGIGKTERIKKLYPDLIYLKLTNNMFPEKVVGSMNLQTGQSIPPDFAKQALLACATDEERKLVAENVQYLYEIADTIYERSKTAKDRVVIMLDELLNVKPAIQSLVYTLVLNKLVETGKGLKLPANTVVVATGNQKKYSLVAEDLAEPLEKRFDHVLDMEPKVSQWLTEYAIPEKVHPAVMGYIFTKYLENSKSDELKKIGYFYEEPEVGEINLDKFGCRGKTNDPRGWVSISNMLYGFEDDLKNGKFAGKDVEELLKTSLISKLRDEWASEFYDFYNYPVLTIDDIASGNYTDVDLPTDTNEKFAYIAGLLSADEKQLEKARDFIRDYCDPEYLSVYDLYWAGNDEKRMQKIAEMWEKDALRESLHENENMADEKTADYKNISDKNSMSRNSTKKKYKITIDEFWETGHRLAIHTPTKEQSEILRKVFDKMGKKWQSGDSYLDFNCWDEYKGNTTYCNDRCYGSAKINNGNYKIYNFDEVDMEKYLDKQDKKTITTVKSAPAKPHGNGKYKITIDKFWESRNLLAIHTPTKEQARILMKVFNKMGKKWYDGDSYLDSDYWEDCKANTAYSNKGKYGDAGYYHTVYNFDEVDMEKYLDKQGSTITTVRSTPAKPQANGQFKITIDEFWNSHDELAIRTPTEKQAEILMKVFRKMGKKWYSGKSYRPYNNFWETHKEDTAYSNKGRYGEAGYYHTVYNFDEVDMEKYLSKRDKTNINVNSTPTKPQKKWEYKITIDEFWEAKRMIAIHTTTKEQSDILRKVFNKMGRKWSSGESYLDEDYWDKRYKADSVYCNDSTYTSIDKCDKFGYWVYEFDEVDMEKYLEKLGIDLKDLQNEDEKE